QLLEIPLEEQGDFAGAGRPDDEPQRHRPILVLCRDGSYSRLDRTEERAGNDRGGVRPLPKRYATADFGRLPRRATAPPGSSPAQLSHRSACLAPRLASVKVKRIVPPLPSATSVPQLSQTRMVFLAMVSPLEALFSRRSLKEKHDAIPEGEFVHLVDA